MSAARGYWEAYDGTAEELAELLIEGLSAHWAGEGCGSFPFEPTGLAAVFRWGDHAMRVTSWNCLCGDVSDRRSDLAPLHSDLITLQECRRPASDTASVIWRGFDTLPRQGVAVVSTEAAWRLEFVEIPELHPTVVPVHVQAPQPFVFVGVWTHPPYNKVAWEAMTACVAAADGLPVVAAGDFNSSPGVQGKQSQRFLQRMWDELGLVSAYHHFFGESHGEETRASYYQGKEANPFHIDYCFVPEAWVDRLTGVEVGSFADWPQSDHRPLTMDIDIE